MSQLIFTFVFGVYSFYMLRLTKNIWAVILLHSYCNYLGPPVVKGYALWHLLSLAGFALFTYFAY